MVDSSPLNLVTAISDSDLENFVASTLFAQGWSVIFRALDFDSLLSYSQRSDSTGEVLVLSSDLAGLTTQKVALLKKSFSKVFIFSSSQSDPFPDAIAIPKSALELVGLLRGSLRAPMTQPQSRMMAPRRARVIAVASAGSSTGCSTLALNLAYELSLKEQSVLLIDGNAYQPSIATLCGVRGLHVEPHPRAINGYLEIAEVTQENVTASIERLQASLAERDFIIIDVGVVQELSTHLSGRRWSAEVLVWACTFGDDLWVLAKSDLLGLERLRSFASESAQTAIRPKITYLHSQRVPGKQGGQAHLEFQQVLTSGGGAIKSVDIQEYIGDLRSAKASHAAQQPLYEVNEKSPLRKSIAIMAGQLIA